jgi:hypothetical protein
MRKLTATAFLGIFVGFGMIAADAQAADGYQPLCVYNHIMAMPEIDRLPADKRKKAHIGFLVMETLVEKSMEENGYLGGSLDYAGSFVKSFDGSGFDIVMRDALKACLHPAVGLILEAVK